VYVPRSVKPAKSVQREQDLLRAHRQHMGVYNRVALRLGVHPSYVSRVAKGTRPNEKVFQALIDELSSIQPALALKTLKTMGVRKSFPSTKVSK
jgi:hypothetical protein